jgi:hypothetical protein
MRVTRIEKEVEIYGTNLASKTKCMSTNGYKKMEKKIMKTCSRNVKFRTETDYEHIVMKYCL